MRSLALAVGLCLFAAAPRAEAGELLWLAAASTADAAKVLGDAFLAREGVKVVASFAGSNELARQVKAGAKAQLFLSADEASVDALPAGRVRRRVPLLSNSLVVIVPASAPKLHVDEPSSLARFQKIAVADPAAVPAGKYAKAWLQKLGVWDALAPRMIPLLDVRAALAAVASGRADAGIVYATDAATSDQVRVVLRAARGDAPKITYTLALLSEDPSALALFRFLQSDEAKAVWMAHGFVAEPAAP